MQIRIKSIILDAVPVEKQLYIGVQIKLVLEIQYFVKNVRLLISLRSEKLQYFIMQNNILMM